MKHAISTGLKKSKKVYMFSKSGKYITEYFNSVEAEKITEISGRSIGEVCRGNRKSAGGYIWRYTHDID
ncbi:hypothetical protein PSYJYH_000022 [Bacillus phage PSYJ-YH]|nr:hypothetical protein PSYJYH_000022 [Bacillus phage PSYJ-YH]